MITRDDVLAWLNNFRQVLAENRDYLTRLDSAIGDADHGITIARRLVGNYITSLEMAGCSITLLKADDDLIKLWDAPVKTPGLRWGV